MNIHLSAAELRLTVPKEEHIVLIYGFEYEYMYMYIYIYSYIGHS